MDIKTRVVCSGKDKIPGLKRGACGPWSYDSSLDRSWSDHTNTQPTDM